MIISLDGNTYLGKTHLLTTLQAKHTNCTICPEYDTQLDLINGKTHIEKQQYYFSLEKERICKLDCQNLVFLDRSFLSVLAHSFAISCMTGIDELNPVIALFLEELNKGNVICPDAVILFVQSDCSRIYSDVDQKGCEDILFDTQYREKIDLFHKKIYEILGMQGYSESVFLCENVWKMSMAKFELWIMECILKSNLRQSNNFLQGLVYAVKTIGSTIDCEYLFKT